MRLSDELADRIATTLPQLPAGRLPTVRQFAARWGASTRTTQFALGELRKRGLVESRPGAGLWRAGEMPTKSEPVPRDDARSLALRLQKEIDALNVPAYWVRQPRILSASTGTHRWVWNLHYPDPSVLTHEYPISAIPHDTPRLPLGTSVLPGNYTVRLTVNGKSYTQPLIVKMDPRVRATPADLQQQFALSMRIAAMIERDFTAIAEARALHVQLDSAKSRATNPKVRSAIDSLDARIGALSITRLNGQLSGLLGTIDGVDARPTTQATAAVTTMQRDLDQAIAEWTKLKGSALSTLNAKLSAAGIRSVAIPRDLTPYRNSLQVGETADKDDNEP